MNRIFVATNNAHKLSEINDILLTFGINVSLLSPKDFNLNEEPIEDGLSFEENALIKARYYYNLVHLPTIADDSGISIEYFNNHPGIHSARFLGNTSYNQKLNHILKLMNGVENRKAHFNCVLAYIDEKGNQKTYSGQIDGNISDSIRGTNGFGYDPIFCYGKNNMTNAELPIGSKNEFSHRYIVLKKWAQDVKNK